MMLAMQGLIIYCCCETMTACGKITRTCVEQLPTCSSSCDWVHRIIARKTKIWPQMAQLTLHGHHRNHSYTQAPHFKNNHWTPTGGNNEGLCRRSSKLQIMTRSGDDFSRTHVGFSAAAT